MENYHQWWQPVDEVPGSRMAAAPLPSGEGADAFHTRTSGIYVRADPGDAAVLDGNDAAERAALIKRRLEEWKSFAN